MIYAPCPKCGVSGDEMFWAIRVLRDNPKSVSVNLSANTGGRYDPHYRQYLMEKTMPVVRCLSCSDQRDAQ